MIERWRRLVAVVRADFLVRLRRPSTLVVFLLLSATPYLWIPAPSTGTALLQINGHRAIYNSAALGMSTALLATIFVGLFGFYVISNALRRDLVTRCGYVMASTTMRGSEYLAGKFAGNVVFLSVFIFGFMVASMAMLFVRGEARFEPLVFAGQYLVLVPPAIVFVSALAILFECTPLLRTKFGDVLYFFFWTSLAGVTTVVISTHPTFLARCFDVSGLGYLLLDTRARFHTDALTLGSSPFNPRLSTIVYPGLTVTWSTMFPRLIATVWPLSLLGAARLFFHRFDPARVRAVDSAARRSWIGRFNALAAPLARPVTAALRGSNRSGGAGRPAGARASLIAAVRADAATALGAMPAAIVAIAGLAIASLVSSRQAFFGTILPMAIAAAAVVVADISSRERRFGTTALVFSTPSLRSNFAAWKFASALMVAALFVAIPIARVAATRPSSLAAVVVGTLFTVAAATALGIVSGNPKAFLVLFLSFWYVAIQDHGATRALDFAGWHGRATPAITAAYAVAAIALVALAHLAHANELRRRW